MKFVGLDNYKKLFTDEAFYGVLKNTFLFTVITVALKVGLGVVIANFVATKVKGKVGSFIMESALFMPIVITILVKKGCKSSVSTLLLRPLLSVSSIYFIYKKKKSLKK